MYYQKRTDTTFACPVVGRRELEYRQKLHRDKVQRMTSAIDTRPPAPQPHLTLYGRDYVAKKRATTEAAFADLKMIQSIARTMTRPMSLPERKGPISLNSGNRKQEIFRVMHENHRMLNSLETLEPVVSTKDLLRTSRWRQRYLINCSHSKRLSGEYDQEITRHQTEDREKSDKYRQSVELRRSQRMAGMSNSGSFSMPSLTPAGAGGSSGSQQFPSEKKNRKHSGSQSAGLPAQQSDGRPDNSAGRQEAVVDNRHARVSERKTSFVHFPDDLDDDKEQKRKPPVTPHPRKGSKDLQDEILYLPSGEVSPVYVEPVAASTSEELPSEKRIDVPVLREAEGDILFPEEKLGSGFVEVQMEPDLLVAPEMMTEVAQEEAAVLAFEEPVMMSVAAPHYELEVQEEAGFVSLAEQPPEEAIVQEQTGTLIRPWGHKGAPPDGWLAAGGTYDDPPPSWEKVNGQWVPAAAVLQAAEETDAWRDGFLLEAEPQQARMSAEQKQAKQEDNAWLDAMIGDATGEAAPAAAASRDGPTGGLSAEQEQLADETAAWAAAFGVDAPTADRPTEVGIVGGEASGTQEFDPSGQSGAAAGDDEYEDDFDADESALSGAGGLSGTTKDSRPKKKETFEPFEEDDAEGLEESATFEQSQSDAKQ